VQFALVVQAGTLQVLLAVSHALPPVHCALVRHSTQTLRATSHAGVAPPHCASVVQATAQLWVATSQVFPPEQLALFRQPTHLPAAVSQKIAPHCASVVQAVPGATAALLQLQLCNKTRLANANSAWLFMVFPPGS
jgi:hypothetical protein